MARVGGTIFVRVNGTQRDAKGNFTYHLGIPKREAVIGPDRVHGYKEMPQVSYIEGAITDQGDLNVKELQELEDATVSIDLANGKSFSLSEAYYAHDGGITTEEGEIPVRFEGVSGEEDSGGTGGAGDTFGI